MDTFTEEDPGLGDPEAIDELIWALRRNQTSLENAHSAVQKSARTIHEHWKGRAGEAAAATHARLSGSIEAKHAALDRAVFACGQYQQAHDEVKASAAAWVIQLAEARKALGVANSTIAGPEGAPGADDLVALATRNKTAALEEEAEALSHLRALHDMRIEAQSSLRTAIAEITQNEHGSVITARAVDDPGPNGPPRYTQGPNVQDMQVIRELVARANDSVWKMAAAWVVGKGPREFEWNGDDAFTQVFRQSASAARAKADIQASILKGKYEGKDGVSARGEDLPRDLITILNRGDVGNLPEAFLGSFDYEYEVTRVNADGTAVVTIHAWNYTTVESATRIPGSGDWPLGPHYLGPYASMKFMQDVLGGFQPVRQDVTWTETVRMPN